MYHIITHVLDNNSCIKQRINSQTMYQLIFQLINQVSNNIQGGKPFINYTNHVSVIENLYSNIKPTIYQLFCIKICIS